MAAMLFKKAVISCMEAKNTVTLRLHLSHVIKNKNS